MPVFTRIARAVAGAGLALALLLVGPGRLSLDWLLFGRAPHERRPGIEAA